MPQEQEKRSAAVVLHQAAGVSYPQAFSPQQRFISEMRVPFLPEISDLKKINHSDGKLFLSY